MELDFLKELSLQQKELSLRIFNIAVSKALKRAFINFDEKTKENMEKVFNSKTEKNSALEKEQFVKNNIPNFEELVKEEITKIENNIKLEIERMI